MPNQTEDRVTTLKARYGASEAGNFYVIDTIGVPHPYTIGAKHVDWACNHHNGALGAGSIESGEKNGIKCTHPCCTLSYADHKYALLVECKAPMRSADDTTNEELRAYLLKCAPLCEADKYEGFAFIERE